MRTYIRPLLLLTAATFWTAARPLDILADLDITPDELQQICLNNLQDNTFHLPDVPYKAREMARQLSVGARVEAVRAVGKVVRAYVETAEFRGRYDDYLRNEYHVSDAQTQEARQVTSMAANAPKQQLDQAVAQVNRAMASMEPAMLAMMIQSQIQVTKQEEAESTGAKREEQNVKLAVLMKLQALSRSNPAEFKKQYLAFMSQDFGKEGTEQLKQNEARRATDKARAAEYQKRLADYNAHANPAIALKTKLRRFIALTESVDFDAKVTRQGYRTEFVEAAYRQKDNHWKLLYRMGREPVMAARAFAQIWLQDLEQTARR